MRIKSLQVHGFKSFVDRTVFRFQDGITAVVGPNGCGKSNVVDAVRWVMGEQSPRRLRGKDMEDVIFSGSDSRPPIGMAEVVLSFDNSDGRAPAAFSAYSEIQICRRLYRSGESEYLINKTPARLRDVHDFFRDSGVGAKGYTIVEQGRVAEIVSAKPEERRTLIEEAAGISKYKARRREAESKIASTEQNLVRVSDVLSEIRRQISSLERQARKAARYKRLHETARVLELSVARDERGDLAGDAERAGVRQTLAREHTVALDAKVAERELAIERSRIALVESEKAVAASAERLFTLRGEIREVESRAALAKREREGLAEANQERRGEISQLESQQRTSDEEAALAQAELTRLETSVASEQETIGRAEAETREASAQLRELERQREGANGAFVEVLTGIARREDRQAAVADRRAEIESRLRSADRELEVQQSEAAQADSTQQQLEDGLRNLLSERDRLGGELRRALDRHARAVDQARHAAEGLREQRERLGAKRARLESLREVLDRREDVSAAARFVLSRDPMEQALWGVRGLVRDLISVDPELEPAVEALLSERAEAIVVDRVEGVMDALEGLRRADVGRGVFMLEGMSPDEPAGFVPCGEPLLERVRFRPEAAPVLRRLLGDVQLVPSLDVPLTRYQGVRLPCSFVTPRGDVLTPDGVVRGGGSTAQNGALARVREVRELEAEVEAALASAAVAEQGSTQAEHDLVRAADELENLRNRHHTSALALASHEKDLERTRERVKAIGEAREGRSAERSELVAETESLAIEAQRLAAQLDTAKADRAHKQRELDAAGLRMAATARELSRLENRATELRTAHAGRLAERDRLAERERRARQAASDTRDWIARREREIRNAEEKRSALATAIEACDRSLAGLIESEERARLESERLRDAFDADSTALRGQEETLRELRAQVAASREEASVAELALREAELRLRHLDDAIREKWGVELASWELPPLSHAGPDELAVGDEPALSAPGSDGDAMDEAADDEEALVSSAQAARDARRNAELARLPRAEREQQLSEVRSRLHSLGDVNLGAIEEHEELAERARFLEEQKRDLDNTIAALREAIARINRTSRRRFRETFDAVSKAFSENFPRMFGGGKASLVLTEHEDILEAGVDIFAQPPGKRLQNVNLLSGGEKTMTALALLVAVFQVRPSPFFLLDEVDAALDDANVGRFNHLLREMAHQSQFLVITHNKRTIETADVLYGVTMEQKGVSKLVTVELH